MQSEHERHRYQFCTTNSSLLLPVSRQVFCTPRSPRTRQGHHMLITRMSVTTVDCTFSLHLPRTITLPGTTNPVWEETVSRDPCTGTDAWELAEDIANCGGQQQETRRGIRRQNEYRKPGKPLLMSWIWNAHTGWCTVKHVLSHDFGLFLPFFSCRETTVLWWYIILGCERHTELFFSA